MNTRELALSLPLLCAVLASAASAQGTLPGLWVSASADVRNGDAIGVVVRGVPGRSVAVLADTSAGPLDLFGERIDLGLTANTFTLLTATLSPVGEHSAILTIPAGSSGLDGLALHYEAFELDGGAPNGMFRTGGAESTTFYSGARAIEERFDDPQAAGFIGNYDSAAQGRLQGGAVRVRTQSTADPLVGVPFGQGVVSPLGAHGTRAQFVYRAHDLRATGEEELVTAVRWRAFGGSVVADSIPQIDIRIGHTDVVPDYTVHPFSALPAFPNSGLDPTFSLNERPGAAPQSVYSGSYNLTPSSLRGDGYVDYPLGSTAFAYDGTSSMLLDIRVPPTPGRAALNGQIVKLMVLSSPLPGARNVATGTAASTINPDTVTTGQADNALHDYQIEFTRVKTTAVSPWRAGGLAPDYHAPVLAAAIPTGTSVSLEFRGANDGAGNGATGWSSSIDIADGREFVQYRVTFVADPVSGAVPTIDSLVIPIN